MASLCHDAAMYQSCLPRHLFTGLLPVMLTSLTDEYQEANLAMKQIKDKNYFRSNGGSGGPRGLWPEALEPLSNKDLAASALGALVAHLTRIKVRISSHIHALLAMLLCLIVHNCPTICRLIMILEVQPAAV